MFRNEKCPLCGYWHDLGEGGWIQTEDPEETKFVCLDCFESYLEEEPE